MGISISEYEDMTPYQLIIYREEYLKKQEYQSKESIMQAYLISRWVWQKKIDIKKILKLENKREVMTDEQMLERVKQLNRLFGGEVIQEGGEINE